MKKNLFKIVVAVSALLIGATSAHAQTMEERLEALEEKALLDSFEFGGMFNAKYQNTVTQVSGADEKKYNYWTLMGHINVNSEVNENINFYSQIGISKIFNNFIQADYTSATVGGTTDGVGALSPSSAHRQDKAFFKRFYIDYKWSDKLIMSVGRLPTGGGNPTNFQDGVARQSTYPQFAYNAQFDGLALTYRLNDNMSFRVINTPFHNSVGAGTIGSTVYRGSASGSPTTAEEVEEHIDFTAYQFDWNTKFSWTKNFNLVYQHVNSASVVFDKPLLGAAYISAAETSYSINWHTLYIEMLGLANSNFDLALSHLQSGVKIANLGGVAAANQLDKTVGNTHINLKYNIGESHVGAEFWDIPRYSSYFDSASEWFGGPYATQGKHYHIYYTMRRHGNTAFRVGYMNLDQEYKSVFSLGTAEKKTAKTGYVNMRVDF